MGRPAITDIPGKPNAAYLVATTSFLAVENKQLEMAICKLTPQAVPLYLLIALSIHSAALLLPW